MKLSVKIVIGIVISLLLIGILLPIGIDSLTAYNGSYTNSTGSIIGYNTTIATLVSSIIPVMAVIGLILAFVPSSDE